MEKVQEEEKQLTLELQEPFANKLLNVKSKVDKSLRIFEVQKFTRSWVLWFTIIFSLSAIFVQVYYLFTKFSSIPNVVPALKMYVTLERTLIQKEYLYAFPILSLVILVASFFISSSTYPKNNATALIILFLSTLSILIFSYNLIELIAKYNV